MLLTILIAVTQRTLMSIASPTPSSMPACAGATRLVHRYTAGSRSPGLPARMALNAAVRVLMISSRFVVVAMLCREGGWREQSQQLQPQPCVCATVGDAVDHHMGRWVLIPAGTGDGSAITFLHPKLSCLPKAEHLST